jgi:hypothetical protein
MNRERGGASMCGLSRLSPVQATVATGDPTLEVPPAKLLREPLFWASSAAFVGVAVGLAALFSMAAWWYFEASGVSSGPPALADWRYLGGPSRCSRCSASPP